MQRTKIGSLSREKNDGETIPDLQWLPWDDWKSSSPNPLASYVVQSLFPLTDTAFHAFNSALLPSMQTERAPRYRVLPNETDLNTPPHLSSIPDLPWESVAITSNLTRCHCSS